ncbi:hypothetical protein [Methylobacillus sp.]|uniref:hypothetical protein n=1 Tax=Methylobacillus sp. TaxID=56818 RepID=UPI0012C5DA1B|nr:hypothetical protein [Methylobacillus sp.]MPS48478.1 hypothetical protein [Methylobacillus sp.]
MHIIEFTPPMLNLAGTFNTFRLGLRYHKILTPGERVVLIDKKALKTIGEAVVEQVIKGRLGEMAELHAAENHNWRDSDQPPEDLIASMTKRYGPHMVNPDKWVSVIYLTIS